MTDHVKHLPAAAIPAPGLATWNVPDTERWHPARVPAVLAPVPGSWALAALALAVLVLRAWSQPETAAVGSAWWGYAEVALLTALPLWFRFLPVLALLSASVIAALAYGSLTAVHSPDVGGRFAYGLTIALCVCAAAGVAGRLFSRRLQRAAVLANGLLANLDNGAGRSYDAFWQQFIALPLLLPGTTLLGRGLAARRAARRLHRARQPALRVGVRTAPTGVQWLHPDDAAARLRLRAVPALRAP